MNTNEQAFESWMVVYFDYGKDDLNDMQKLQTELEQIVSPSGLGDVDGHEIATDLSKGMYWIVCRNPSDVFTLIKDHLEKTTLVKVTEVKIRRKEEGEYSSIFKTETAQ